MNKTDLIDAMAEKAGISKIDARKALEAFVDVTKEEVKKGESVAIIGFGTFTHVERKEREGLNPANKQKIIIPAKKSPKFKISKAWTI